MVPILNKGYIRETIPSDRECAYTAIDITRDESYCLIIANISKVKALQKNSNQVR